MDAKLVGNALQFHGVELMNSLTTEQQEQPSAAILSYLDRKQHRDPEIKDEEFQKRMCSFIGRKSDMLFKPLSEEEKNRRNAEEVIDDAYAIMPAMEAFMDVPSHLRREHFFKSLRPDDCVTGVVLSVLENGLRIQLLCVDKGCSRDIDDLDIQVFCPLKELPKLYPNASALDAFQEKDIVRGIVLVVNIEAERIIISLHEKAIPNKNTYPRIGLITEEEFPVHYRRKKQIQGMSYEEMLHSILGFNNMGNVKVLVNQLGIQDSASYMRYHSRLQIPEKEYAEGLRKWQSQKLAHQSVAQGVEMFKSGKYLEALQYFNRALQIDKQNVEALVARGALHANKENFNHAIQDFEEALSINPKHSNARNYLTETLLTFGKICEDKQQLEEATVHYSHVLKIDPHHTEAKEMLAGCQHLMAVQTAPGKGKMEIKKTIFGDADVKDKKGGTIEATIFSKTAHKLRQLINEDKKGKLREKKWRHRTSSLSEKPRKKRKRRSSSSSSSSSTSSNSSSSDSSSSTSSSSSSEHRTKGKKGFRKSKTESDFSPQEERRKHKKSSSVRARKRRRIEKGERKQSLCEMETIKDAVNVRLRDKKPGHDTFVQKVETSSAGGLLQTSIESAGISAAISSLDRKTSYIAAAERLSRELSRDPLYGRNVERPHENFNTLRRDDFLMAEREKFYKDNKDRYKRAWPQSRDRSSSSSDASSKSSGSSHKKYLRRRNKSNDGSKSKLQMKRSPAMTGIKDLDIYLGGAKKLLNRMDSKEKPSTWEYFSDLFTKKSRLEGSSVQRPHSRDTSSRSQEMSNWKSISRQMTKENRSENYESNVGQDKNWQEDKKFGNTSRHDSTEEEDNQKFKLGYPENDSLKDMSPPSNNKASSESRLKLVDDGSKIKVQEDSSEELKLTKHNDHRKKTFLGTKSGIVLCLQGREDSKSKRTEEGLVGRGMVDERDDTRNYMKASMQSEEGAGKVNPDIQKEAEIVGMDLQQKNYENNKDDKLINDVGEQLETRKQMHETSEQIFDESFQGPKASKDALLLQKPRMDDSELQKPLFTSNELTAIESEQKMQKLEASKVSPNGKVPDKQKNKSRSRSMSSVRSRSTERTRSRSTSRSKRKQSRSTERTRSRSTSRSKRKRSRSTQRTRSRSTSSVRSRSTERTRSRSTSRSKRKRSRSTERTRSRSTSSVRSSADRRARSRRSSKSTERTLSRSRSRSKRKRSRSTERTWSRSRSRSKRKRSRSTERTWSRSTSRSKRKSRSTERTWSRSTSRSKRKSISTERTRSRSTSRSKRKSRSTERTRSRSTSRSKRKSRSTEITRSRSTSRSKRKSRSTERTLSRSTNRSKRKNSKSTEQTWSRNSSIDQRKQNKDTERARSTDNSKDKIKQSLRRVKDAKVLDKKKKHGKKKKKKCLNKKYRKKKNKKHGHINDKGHKRNKNIEVGNDKFSRRNHEKYEKYINHDVPSDSRNHEVQMEKKWLDTDEMEKEIERRVQERLKAEEDKQKKEIGHLKNKWDSDNKDIKDVNKWHKLDKVGNNSESKQSKQNESCKSDLKQGQLGISGLQQKSSILKGQKLTHFWKSAGIHRIKPALSSKMKHFSSGFPHSKWDRDDTTRDNKKAELEVRHTGQKADKVEKTAKLESLTDLEKFLIELKQQKKKQWISEGKLKKKY